MTQLIHISLFLGLFTCGVGNGSAEFIRIERLFDRVIIAYRLGTGRMNIVAIQSQKGLTVIDTAMSPRIGAFPTSIRSKPPDGPRLSRIATSMFCGGF